MALFSYNLETVCERDMRKFTQVDFSSRYRFLQMLLMMSIACCLLTGFRIYWTKNLTYLYLIWNLILAWVPLIIAYRFQKYYCCYPKKYLVLIFMSLAWLLFFPNGPYIITDLIHLNPRNAAPMWFDAILIFAFALSGLISGFVSLYFIHEILDNFFPKLFNWGLVILIFILSGYGIYLGRVLRWNSWDLFTSPKLLFLDVTGEIDNPQAIFMTMVFSFFMFFSYLILHSIIHLKHQIPSDDPNKKNN